MLYQHQACNGSAQSHFCQAETPSLQFRPTHTGIYNAPPESELGQLDHESLDVQDLFHTWELDGDFDGELIIEKHAGILMLIEDFVELVQKYNVPAWRIKSAQHDVVYVPTVIGRKCEASLALIAEVRVSSLPVENRYSERFYVFAQACEEMRHLGQTALGCRLRDPVSRRLRCEAENALVSSIRAKTRSRRFRDQYRHRQNLAKEHEMKGLAFLNRAFQHHSKLLIGRVDLHYSKHAAASITLKQVQADLLCLWRRRRQTAPTPKEDPFVGYIRGIEFARRRWYHMHVLLLFNGHKAKSAYFHGDQLGKLWVEVTEGRGTYFNCAASKRGYRWPFLGVVDARDAVKRSWILEKGIKYLTKNDKYSMALTGGLHRFQTSQLKKVKGPGGRRRSLVPDN